MARRSVRWLLLGFLCPLFGCGPGGNVANNWQMGILGPAGEATIVAYSCADAAPSTFEVALAGVADGGNVTLVAADADFVEGEPPNTFTHRFVGGDLADQIATLSAYPEDQHIAVKMSVDGHPQILDFQISELPEGDELLVAPSWFGSRSVSMEDFVAFNEKECDEAS